MGHSQLLDKQEEPLLQNADGLNMSDNPDVKEPSNSADYTAEEEETIEYQSETVLTILKPVSITMLFVVWAVKTINLSSQGTPSRFGS